MKKTLGNDYNSRKPIYYIVRSSSFCYVLFLLDLQSMLLIVVTALKYYVQQILFMIIIET